MSGNLVTLAVYQDLILANVNKTKLLSEGIYAFIANEKLVGFPQFGKIFPELLLQVKENDIKRAKKVLKLK